MVVDWPSQPIFDDTVSVSGVRLHYPLTTPLSSGVVPSLFDLIESQPENVVVVFHDDAQAAASSIRSNAPTSARALRALAPTFGRRRHEVRNVSSGT